MQHTKEAQKKVSTMLDRVGLLMEKLEHRNSTSIKDGATPDGILHQLSEANEQQQKLRNIPLSSSSKKAVKDTINAKITLLGKNLKQLTSTTETPSTEESDNNSN
jgi:hypothetical protein